jgi:hypothetical protein
MMTWCIFVAVWSLPVGCFVARWWFERAWLKKFGERKPR